jgi:hypothetical protein
MSCNDNYIIEDYFQVKERLYTVEEKQLQLEQRIKQLEDIIFKYIQHKEHPGIIKRVSKTYDTMFGYYEKIKVINIVILFFFSNKILSEPRLLLKFYNILKHSINYLYS